MYKEILVPVEQTVKVVKRMYECECCSAKFERPWVARDHAVTHCYTETAKIGNDTLYWVVDEEKAKNLIGSSATYVEVIWDGPGWYATSIDEEPDYDGCTEGDVFPLAKYISNGEEEICNLDNRISELKNNIVEARNLQERKL